MKFFVSDHIKLPNRFGKWYYWHDSDIQIHKKNNSITLYHGYAIEDRTLEEYVDAGERPKNLNGNFSVVRMEHDSIIAYADYFSQNRIYYQQNEEGLSLTNRMYLFPFKTKDMIFDKIHRYHSIDYESKPNYTSFDFQKLFEQRGGMDATPFPGDLHSRGTTHYSVDNTTSWNNTHNLVPGAVLHYRDRLHLDYTSEHDRICMEALNSEDKRFKTFEHLRDHVHECFESHADIIKKNYHNIVCSVSEGIDSALYNAYFPNARKITHTLINYGDEEFCGAAIETSADPKFKRLYLGQFDKKLVREDFFDVKGAPDVAKKWLNDTELKHLDCLPTYAQIMEHDRDMDIFIFGQQADQVFMHNAEYYLTYAKGTLRDSGISIEEQFEKYKDFVDQLKGCYASKEVSYGKNFWEYRKDYKIDSLEEFKKSDEVFYLWKEWISYACKATFYNREISHISDKTTTSLYSDTRMFHSVRQSTPEIMLANMKDAYTQKQILLDKFGYRFQTPFKNGTYFNLNPLINVFTEKTRGYCLKEHLKELTT